jgi:hypothetical protein
MMWLTYDHHCLLPVWWKREAVIVRACYQIQMHLLDRVMICYRDALWRDDDFI